MGLKDLVAPTDIFRDVRNLASANLAKMAGEDNYEFGLITRKVVSGLTNASGGGGASEAAIGSQRKVMNLLATSSDESWQPQPEPETAIIYD